MTLGLEELEPRLGPAVDAGAGTVYLAAGVARHCFEDAWSGPLNVYDPGGDRVYVGAGAGGGPRVQVYDRAGGLLEDFFAGDPGSRAGVYFIPTDPPPPPPATPAYGDPSAPGVFPVWVAFAAGQDAGYRAAFLAALWAYLGPAGDLALAEVPPDRSPLGYGTVVVGAPLGWAGPGVAGVSVGRWDARPAGPPAPVYVAPGSGPELAAVEAAHEVGHAFGLGHSPDPSDVMYFAARRGAAWSAADLAAVRAGVARAAS